MATSAIGPGFITQTAVFTSRLGASFGFVILASVLLDIVVQLTIWRTSALAGKKAPQIADEVLPGSGLVLAILSFLGGLVFNMGNLAGCGMAAKTLFAADPLWGAGISVVLAMMLFWGKAFGRALDAFTAILGAAMLGMVFWVATRSNPPAGLILRNTFAPTQMDALAILTLVGGTVGGYISFSGAHRMLDAAGGSPISKASATRSAVTGILLSAFVRWGLFLAVFGVIHAGFYPDPADPAASVFRNALGLAGQGVFGFVFWCASITSVIGASYTSVSFIENFNPCIQRNRHWVIILFIVVSLGLFAFWGSPVNLLVKAGTINGLVLPFGLLLYLLWVIKKRKAYGETLPAWLQLGAWLVLFCLLVMGFRSFNSLL